MLRTRREFLTWAGAVVGTTAAGGIVYAADRSRSAGPRGGVAPASAASAPSPATTSAASTSLPAPATTTTTAATPTVASRVLVVVQLGGGNDGLNTLVPLQGAYHDARPTLGVADDTLLPFPGTEGYGLHSALRPLEPLLASGRVAALEAIGYTHPDRSHFSAFDDWWSATPGRSSTTGWLGRWLDLTASGADDPLRAVALGGGAPALIGERSRPTVVLSPKAFALRGPPEVTAALTRDVPAGDDLAARYRQAVADAAHAVGTFGGLHAAAPADGAQTGEGADGEIERLLTTAAQLVVSVPATQVVQVGVGGFDTHAAQAATHERLLGDLASGVASFFATLDKAGQSERVLLVTVSEFGRRVRENGGGGTDHGKASVAFVAGQAVRAGVYGNADLARLDDGDLTPQLDVRQLYAAALGWLGGPVDEVLGGPYDALGVVLG